MYSTPFGLFSRELGTFMPYTLATKVGSMMMIDMDVNCFMVLFKLFDITEAYAFMVLLSMLR